MSTPQKKSHLQRLIDRLDWWPSPEKQKEEDEMFLAELEAAESTKVQEQQKEPEEPTE